MDANDNHTKHAEQIRAVIERYRSDLRRVVQVRMDPRLAARFDPSDVLQEVMMQATPQIPTWLQEEDKSVYACLYRLTRDHLARLQRDHVATQRRSVEREQVRHELADESIDVLVHQLAAAQSSPSQRFARAESHRRLREALDQLRETDREVLVMRVLEGTAVRDVSQVLGISEAAVKMRHLRAIERLRILMTVDGSEGFDA